MELVSGEPLAERIGREGAVPVEDALAIAKQIAEALEAAHEKNIIHRDLKPANAHWISWNLRCWRSPRAHLSFPPTASGWGL
jgi:tRNA A-37 threonylcarbamoyl transferase component Bud32